MLNKCVLCILLTSTIFITACNSGINLSEEQRKKAATNEAEQFFRNHPEYTLSEEREKLLFVIFQHEVTKPENKHKKMYEILNTAHSQVGLLMQFSREEIIS